MPHILNFPKSTNLDVTQQSEGLSSEYSEGATGKSVSELSSLYFWLCEFIGAYLAEQKLLKHGL